MLIKPNNKVATLEEIAAECGVSLSTVYRILRDPNRAKKPISQQVRGLLVQNGYLSNVISNAKMNLIFVSYENATHEFALFYELQQCCMLHGVNLSMCMADDIENMISSLDAKGVFVYRHDVQNLSVPCVKLRADFSTANYSSVSWDILGGITAFFAKLKELGHKRIFYFYPKLEYDLKIKGLGHMFSVNIPYFYLENNLEYDPELVCCREITPETHAEVMDSVVEYFLSLPNRPTAAAFAGDTYAMYFQQRLIERGFHIPADISIVGVDNLRRYYKFWDNDEPFLQEKLFLKPRISTLDFPHKEIGEAALQLLQELIINPNAKRKKLLIFPELIITDSISKCTIK